MVIGELLNRGAISLRVTASSKRQVLGVIAEIAARSFGLKVSDVLDALVEREAAGSTGVGHGVAVPHARVAGLDQVRGVFVRLETPVAFDAVDDQPADLFFALLATPEASTEHLRALARVSRLLRQSDMREQLRNVKTADAVLALVGRVAQPTAA